MMQDKAQNRSPVHRRNQDPPQFFFLRGFSGKNVRWKTRGQIGTGGLITDEETVVFKSTESNDTSLDDLNLSPLRKNPRTLASIFPFENTPPDPEIIRTLDHLHGELSPADKGHPQRVYIYPRYTYSLYNSSNDESESHLPL